MSPPPLKPCERPVGVFDSGVGGLSVLDEIRRALPGEDLLYVADSAHAPYGDKPMAEIEARSLAIVEHLVAHGAKAVVVACNTATGAAVRVLRHRFALPIVALEPAIKPAVERTRSGVVGVLATRRTLESDKFRLLMERVAAGTRVLLQPCPGLVERVESGDLSGPGTRALLAEYLDPLLAQGTDTLVLGCTHYPHLAPLIAELAGPEVAILDSGAAVARQLRRRLAELDALAPESRSGRARFWTSGCPRAATDLMARLWTQPLEVERLPERAAAALRAGPTDPAGPVDLPGTLAAAPD